MNKPIYVKVSDELRKRIIAIGEQHGHTKADSSGNVIISTAARWLIEVGAGSVERGDSVEITRLCNKIEQLEADLRAAEMRPASLGSGRG